MSWADLLIRGLCFMAVSFDDCIPIFDEHVYTCGFDDGEAINGTDDSGLVSTFMIDSGASVHCCCHAELFTKFTDHNPKKRVRVASGAYVDVQAIGEVVVRVKDSNGNLRSITLTGVFYCPGLHVDLISTKKLWKDNRIKTSLKDGCVLKDKSGGPNDGCKFILPSTGRQYLLHSRKHEKQNTTKTISALSIEGLNDPVPHDRSDIPPAVLHARLGHTAASRIRRAYHTGHGVPEVSFDDLSKLECDGCDLGGSRKPQFNARPDKYKFTKFGQRIHSDLCGPFPADVHGNTYALCFVDAATGFTDIVFLKSKQSDLVLAAFQEFLKRHEANLPPAQDIEWFTDNGGEFTSKKLDEFCDEFAVKRGFSVPYCPPQNGKAERLWGIVLRGTRIALAHSGAPEHFWSYAMLDALWLHNHLPSRGNAKFVPPIQLAFDLKPDFSRKRVFGCKCYFHLSDYDYMRLGNSKVSPTAVEAICLGFDPKRNGYRVFIPSLNRITSAYKPKFRETQFLRFTQDGQRVPDVFDYDDLPASSRNARTTTKNRAATDHIHQTQQPQPPPLNQQVQPQPQLPQQQQQLQQPGAGTSPANDPRHGAVSSRTQRGDWHDGHCSDAKCTLPYGHDGLHSYEILPGTNGPPAARLRSRHVHFVDGFDDSCADHVVFATHHCGANESKGEFWVLKASISGAITIPKTYAEAMASPQADLWKAAMDKEIKDLMLHGTWESNATVPHGRRVTKSKWVYDVKYNRDGTVERFKARFVVCGYSQVQGYDYDRAFSATLRGTSFRTLIALASVHKLRLEQMDVTNAFTQALIDDVDIFVQPPEGGYGQNPIRLVKALYGTKQASRLWQETLKKYLLEQGFVQSDTEPCIFSKTDESGRKLIVAIYVDDIVIAHNDPVAFTKFKESFLKRFRAKYIGPLSWFLGVAIDRDSKGAYHLHQTKYINDMVSRFVQAKGRHSITRDIPMTPDMEKKLRVAQSDAERAKVKQLPYLQLVGSLLYLAVMTRPDIMACMSRLCNYMHDPSEDCYEAALGVLLYVSRTKDLELTFTGRSSASNAFSGDALHAIESNMGLHAYSDSSWGKAFPMHGYVIFLGGGPVAYSSRMLKIVADSSAEAEYAACSLCAKELVFVRELCRDMGFEIRGPISMGVDNTAAIDIAKDVGVTKRNKHFERALHYIRKEINMLRVLPFFVSTALQVADIFTKILDVKTFLMQRRYIFGK